MIEFYKHDKSKKRLNKHFHLSEFKCKCGNCNLTIIDSDGLYRLLLLRNLYKRVIRITSGYRCPEHHRKLGLLRDKENRKFYKTAKYSYHMQGQAWDIAVPPNHSRELLELIKLIFPFYYINPVAGFIHVDLGIRKGVIK